MNNSIYPCLWFNGQAKQAADFYCAIFNNAKITVDTPMVVNFELEGKKFMGLNGGPQFTTNPSISFFVTYADGAQVEKVWNQLSAGGSALMPLGQYPWSEKYGWVKDQFGVSWQVMQAASQPNMQTINASFLFTNAQLGRAKEAIDFYTGIFPNSAKHHQALYETGDPQPAGLLKFGHFTLNNETFSAMDGPGGHDFIFNEGLSFVIDCDNQEEIDFYWERLTDGGSESQCGWLKDKFGISWQVVPTVLGKLMTDPERAQRVMQAFLKMKKFDIATLMNA